MSLSSSGSRIDTNGIAAGNVDEESRAWMMMVRVRPVAVGPENNKAGPIIRGLPTSAT